MWINDQMHYEKILWRHSRYRDAMDGVKVKEQVGSPGRKISPQGLEDQSPPSCGDYLTPIESASVFHRCSSSHFLREIIESIEYFFNI
jgi:hypothetical protein